MKVTIIAGARPNFMKIAPLVGPLRDVGITPRIVHTGQHYDAKMSQTFFEELNIPHPDVNLEVGSGSHIWQLAEVMKRLEDEYQQQRPDAVIVVGDVNSTFAATLTANKLGIPVAHVEAGLRSYDRAMPEETNRVLTDAISDWLFTSEPSGETNLIREGVDADRIHFVGNIMIDTLYSQLERARRQNHCNQLGLRNGEYAVLTMHRPSNVDDPQRLEAILRAIHEVSKVMPVVFPLHPRTRSRIDSFGFGHTPELNGYSPVEPLGYVSMLSLVDSARLVLTDSGGLQEETTALRVPCLTLRENTERPATVDVGSNCLVGWKTDEILEVVGRVLAGPERFGQVPEKWDGKTAQRIAAKLKSSV